MNIHYGSIQITEITETLADSLRTAKVVTATDTLTYAEYFDAIL